jgi:dihydrofolate reductase
MMRSDRKLVLFIATSLDGYIARKDGSLDWLFEIEGEGDNGYTEFYDTVDTIIMGRRTYEEILVLEPGNFPYKNKECFVFTSKSAMKDNEDVTFIDIEVGPFVEGLKKQEGNNIWIVGGGELLHAFLKAKLVDEFIITIAPTLIGKGIFLYKEMDVDTKLELKEITQFNQFVQMHYVVKDPS